MPDYNFTGAYPRVLAGLSQGVNAWLTPVAPPFGSTIEAHPGDALLMSEPYEHPELAEVNGGLVPPSDPPRDTIPAALDAGYVVPSPAADPAHDVMTAEGAPAPAEPTA